MVIRKSLIKSFLFVIQLQAIISLIIGGLSYIEHDVLYFKLIVTDHIHMY